MTAIARRLRECGMFVFKVHGGPEQIAGIPDLIVCCDGRFVGLEVKRPGEHATSLQLFTIREIQAAGGTAAVVHAVEEALDVIADVRVQGATRDHRDG